MPHSRNRDAPDSGLVCLMQLTRQHQLAARLRAIFHQHFTTSIIFSADGSARIGHLGLKSHVVDCAIALQSGYPATAPPGS